MIAKTITQSAVIRGDHEISKSSIAVISLRKVPSGRSSAPRISFVHKFLRGSSVLLHDGMRRFQLSVRAVDRLAVHEVSLILSLELQTLRRAGAPPARADARLEQLHRLLVRHRLSSLLAFEVDELLR